MLKLYKYLYKLTNYYPSFLQLRINKYAIRRLKRLSTTGYYIGNPGQSLDFWVMTYEVKLGLYRTTFSSRYRSFKRKLRSLCQK